MGLGEKGQRRVSRAADASVKDLFRPTAETPKAGNAQEKEGERKIGRPKGEVTKAKTFSLPLELNQRLRRYAFERECSEVDVVRAALEEYLDRAERGLSSSS